MNVRPFLITHPQTTPVEQPIEAGFNDVAEFAQAAAVFGVAVSKQRLDSPPAQGFTNLGFRIVGSICEYLVGTLRGAPRGCLIGGTASTRGMAISESWQFAPVWAMARGVPAPSTIR